MANLKDLHIIKIYLKKVNGRRRLGDTVVDGSIMHLTKFKKCVCAVGPVFM
jgi:hypothetical protein